jgi:hypothetical protein
VIGGGILGRLIAQKIRYGMTQGHLLKYAVWLGAAYGFCVMFITSSFLYFLFLITGVVGGQMTIVDTTGGAAFFLLLMLVFSLVSIPIGIGCSLLIAWVVWMTTKKKVGFRV